MTNNMLIVTFKYFADEISHFCKEWKNQINSSFIREENFHSLLSLRWQKIFIHFSFINHFSHTQTHTHFVVMNMRCRMKLIFFLHLSFIFFKDIESEPPPDPAPEYILPTHRDISMANINAFPLKQPSNYVLKIDKNGDQIHEEFIPHSQQHGHGKCKTYSSRVE